MQTPERPFHRNVPDDGAPSYEWLDEWLCEYVDGTMDPSVETVFEQYVEANPDLKAHVQRLRQTRELLCGCDAPEDSLADSRAEIQEETKEKLLRSVPPLPEHASERPTLALGVVASVAVALVVGFLAGSVFVDPATFSAGPAVSTVDERTPPHETVREEAPSRRSAASTPTVRSKASSFSADEPFSSRSATVPVSGLDTASSRSPLSALGEH